jgi:hypothetical protein
MPVDPAATRRMIESLSTHLEDHLASWKSALVETRREIDDRLNQMADRSPAQARPHFPEDIVELMLEDAVPPQAAPEKIIERVEVKVIERVEVPVPGASTPGAPDWGTVRGALTAIESARTQVDVLTRFLTQAHSHASRVCLLVLRNERLTGWKAIGWDGTGGRDDAAKGLDVGSSDDPFASEVLKSERSMIALPPSETSPLRKGLGGTPPARQLMVPMVIRDRIAGILIADELPGDEGRLNEAALEALTFVTGLTVDLLAARKKIPSPSLTPTGETIPVFKAKAEAAAPAAPPAAHDPFAFDDPAMTMRATPAMLAPVPTPVTAPPPAPPAPKPQPARIQDVHEATPKPKITDAGQALKALEESAAQKKRTETSSHRVPKPEDLGLTTAIPAARPAAPAPPAPPAAVNVSRWRSTLSRKTRSRSIGPHNPSGPFHRLLLPLRLRGGRARSVARLRLHPQRKPHQRDPGGGAMPSRLRPLRSARPPRHAATRGAGRGRCQAPRPAPRLGDPSSTTREKVTEARPTAICERLRDDIEQVSGLNTPESVRQNQRCEGSSGSSRGPPTSWVRWPESHSPLSTA